MATANTSNPDEPAALTHFTSRTADRLFCDEIWSHIFCTLRDFESENDLTSEFNAIIPVSKGWAVSVYSSVVHSHLVAPNGVRSSHIAETGQSILISSNIH